MLFLDTILDIIFPTNCLSCGKSGAYLCFDCLLKCPNTEKESALWVFPIFDYQNPLIKKSIGLLKYKGKRKIANTFGEIMYGRILEELSDLSQLKNFHNPILIPIPLAPKRQRERGFNQALLICKKLVSLDKNINFKLEKNILIKPKDTEHQARIGNRKKRLKNLIGSFKIKNEERIKNRNIILIDDVTTTGATLSEARKALLKAGAKKIIAFTIAH